MQFALPQTFGMQKQWPHETCGTSSVVIAAYTLDELFVKAIEHRMFTLKHLEEAVEAAKGKFNASDTR